MSNTPNNPGSPEQPKGPWLYSGGAQPTPAYTSPTPQPQPVPSTTSSSQVPPSAAPANPPRASTPGPVAARGDADAQKQSDDASLASIIDTIEAIIIALVLALSFRAFIVEAFVIPTGSMAPTLKGAHFNVICPNCGYAFDRDASLQYQRRNPKPGSPIEDFGQHAELSSSLTVPCDGGTGTDRGPNLLLCPNCQHIIPFDKLPQYLPPVPGKEELFDARTQSIRRPSFAWANNGDRILVLKYIYSLFEPNRFDVIVFKEPMRAQDNFIKRLIGLPGETVEIINGDIYITPPGEDKNDLSKRIIAAKPPEIQKDLWQLIYDNDCYPLDENKERTRPADAGNISVDYFRWRNPWRGTGATADAWNSFHDGDYASVGGPEIHYSATAPGELQFVPRDPYTYNILGYNDDLLDLPNYRNQDLLPVGDLHLETEWTPADEQGASIQLSAGPMRNLFRVTWSEKGLLLERFNMARNAYEALPAGSYKTETVEAPRAGQSYHVELNNVDRTVRFVIDGKTVLQQATLWSAADARKEAEEFAAHEETFMPSVAIQVGGKCTLAHLKLMRDLYYTQSPRGTPRTANMDNPLTLGQDEFFAMGDNSRRSHDGRTWGQGGSAEFFGVYPALDDLGTRRGIVPRRYLLGKAFFVYWPAGNRLTHMKSFDIPVVPNTGEMRFIR